MPKPEDSQPVEAAPRTIPSHAARLGPGRGVRPFQAAGKAIEVFGSRSRVRDGRPMIAGAGRGQRDQPRPRRGYAQFYPFGGGRPHQEFAAARSKITRAEPRRQAVKGIKVFGKFFPGRSSHGYFIRLR